MKQFAVPYFTAKQDNYQLIVVRRDIRKYEGSIFASACHQLAVAADQVDFC
jgi:peptidyl-tRNA hydrolase